MSLLLSLWLVHPAPLNTWMPGDLVSASARGAVRGAVLGTIRDDRGPRPAVRWDGLCAGNPLARGCM